MLVWTREAARLPEADGGHYVGWTLHKKADGKDLKVQLKIVVGVTAFCTLAAPSRMTSGSSLMTTK